ncbi:FAD-binding oxidoreductase [Nitriliruptoria bacterium AS10]|nr:FAD-binding oxidoreductase [Salsipaludibacter albus]
MGALRAGFTGRLVTAEHADYDRRRAVWNGAIDRRPRLIARCADPADVIRTIAFARDQDLEIAVRSGGHSFPGLSVVDDGVVVDLSMMKDVTVDTRARTVRVQAGVLLGELDRATQQHGMAVPTGAVSHTGVAGLTLGGGIGWLMRKYGLTIDRLRAVDLVTADGRRLVASRSRNAELFWGLRGGGGNFGVVTSFTFDLRPVGPTVLSGLVLWPLEEAEVVARAYRAWCAGQPDDLTSALLFRHAPDADDIPEEVRGRPVVGVIGCWSGPIGAGERAWARIRAHGTPLVDLTQPRAFVDHQSMLDGSYPHGIWVHTRACNVAELSDGVIATAVEHVGRMQSPRSSVIAWQLGGAVARPGPDAGAFGGRDAGFVFNITGITAGAEGFAHERAWVRRFGDALAAHETGVYVNFLMEEGDDRVRAAYGSATHRRLRALKRVHDPDNVFHLNQNIAPSE